MADSATGQGLSEVSAPKKYRFLTVLTNADSYVDEKTGEKGPFPQRKKFTPDGPKKIAHGSRWTWEEAAITSFNDLANILDSIATEADSLKTIVFGRVRDDVRSSKRIARRKSSSEQAKATFEEVGSAVLHFDIDALAYPAHLGWHDPEALARWTWSTVIAKLPALDGVSVWWQASNSAGTDGKSHLAKFHFWTLVDQPLSEDERKSVYMVAGADKSLAGTVQKSFCAPPSFDGVADPLEGLPRTGRISGVDTASSVALLDNLPNEVKNAPQLGTEPLSYGPMPQREELAEETTDEGAVLLDGVRDAILSATERNNTIFRESARVGRAVRDRLISLEDAKRTLLRAAVDSGTTRPKEAVVNGLRSGLREVPRDAQGRFTGHAAISTDRPAPRPDFVTVREATARIRDAVGRFVADRPAVMAIAASPGAGKSRIAREVLATALPDLGGDLVYHAPTHDLAEEAAGHFAEMGVTAVAAKGRLAQDKTRDIQIEGKLAPHDTGRMCLRPHLAAAAREAGVGEGQSICKRGSGENEQRCPYWDKCPWVAQWALPEGPVVRCLSHAHLHLPDSSGRGAPALRVVDESCWQGALGKAAVPISEWLKPINPDRFASPDGFDEDDELAAKSADSLAAARDVLEMLQEGGALFELGLSWTVENLREFAKAEDRAPLLGVGPAAFDEKIEQAIGAVGGLGRFAGARAAIWRLLADALEAGRETSERVVLREHPKKGQVIEVHWRKSMPEAATLHLDADADQTILKALYPEAEEIEIVRGELEPNAAIIQTTDKSFSKTALIGTETKPAGTQLRKEIAQLVRVEVLRDRAQRGGGVLVVATKGVVAKIFEEAGAEAKLGAELYGAAWAWFGPATRGLNDWRDLGTVVEIGREELPPDVVEAQARSLWGDSDQPLELPKADAHGNVMAPETVLPVLMADGSAKALTGRAYADPRLRALQVQSRENAGRQAAERLRMAHAVRPKRWIRLNTVPLASAPVTELTAWSALRPDRLTAAVAEAAQGSGLLRLNPKGLAADAPSAFPSVKAAERWLSKSYTPPTSNRVLIRGGGGITALVRRKGQRGPKPTQVLIPAVTCPKAARAVLEEKLGPVAQFEVLEIVQTPQDDAVNEVLNRLSDLEKAIGYCPKVTVRPIESPVFVSGTFPPEGIAAALEIRGWPVELVPD